MYILTAIVFVLIFSLLILVHELGHFLAAKRADVKVEEFGFGLPPRMFGMKKGETIYSLNWIPFGGFVRMLGEDGSDPESKKNKRSFVNKTLWQQTKIVCAGVFMNLFLAFLLLTFGFMIGIEPLIASVDDFYARIRDGVVKVIVDPDSGSIDGTGYGQTYLSRMVYLEDTASIFYGTLKDGDIILNINNKEILNEEDLVSALHFESELKLNFYRPNEGEMSAVINVKEEHPVITYIEESSPAAAYLKIGDKVKSINGKNVSSGEHVVSFTQENESDSITYNIIRDGGENSFSIPLREDGRIGVAVADLVYSLNTSVYESYIPHNVLSIEKVKYGWAAPVQAVKEMWRLGKITAAMFVNVLGNFLKGGEVPEGVSGPVGIAQMTYVFLQDGFAAIIRFVALLSLSLGVINILPIPALDGGRLLFIIIQGFTGKRPSPRIESLIHGAGFVFLLLFIVYVTFNDVLRLF